MVNQVPTKPKLLDILPEGLAVDNKWLINHGFSRSSISYYVGKKRLSALHWGLYARPGVPIKWEGLVQSLTEMGYKVHIGGEQALVEQGFGHFVSMSKVTTVHLYSATRLPKWLKNWQGDGLNDGFRVVVHRLSWLESLGGEMFTQRSYGLRDWKIGYAQTELAVLECLHDCHVEADFQQVDRWFESLHSLSPNRLQSLLGSCSNIKIKRLFGWFSDRHNHAWAKHLDWDKVDMGKGKRMIVKGGSFDKRRQITVPKSMEAMDGYE